MTERAPKMSTSPQELPAERRLLWDSVADRVNNALTPWIGLIEDKDPTLTEEVSKLKAKLHGELRILEDDANKQGLHADAAAIRALAELLAVTGLTTLSGITALQQTLERADPRRAQSKA